MALGPIMIYLNDKEEGDPLFPQASSADIVEQDKDSGKEDSRITNPQQKQLVGIKDDSSPKNGPIDLHSNFIVTNTNAIVPETIPVGTAEFSDEIQNENISNKEDDLDTSNGVNGQGSGNTGSGADESNIAEEFRQTIFPRENPFKEFATMTYSVSLYMMGSKEYSAMISSGVKTVKDLTLMLQSGGISKTPEGNHGAVRSEYFDVDFYIDDVDIKGLVSGTSVSSPHNQFEMKFTITEPNGLSFLERLHAMVQEYNISKGISKNRINYATQNYLMVVRFYGYDENGKQITGRDIGISESLSDLTAVSEKFIPFQFTGIKFALENDVVRYRCEAVCPQTQIPIGVANSTITFNMELIGQSVGDVLSANSIPTVEVDIEQGIGDGVRSSLVDALNTAQKRMENNGQVEFAHKYIIEFEEDSGIAESLVTTTGEFTDKEKTPMGDINKKHEALLTNKGFYDKNQKMFSITAGQSIVQAIDMIIRTSTYISNQQDIIIDEVTGKVTKKEKAPTVLQWFKIRTQVKPLQYDSKRADYAYEIKYVISRYQINNIRSPYFGPTKFRGTHKEYDYWFTGKNTEVLDFKQEYNYLYYQTFGGDMGVPTITNNARELTKQVYQSSASESAQGGKNRRNEASANAASLLYSPSDQANAQLMIIGDPDWMAQSEIFYSPDATGIGLGPFMSDGSVNYDASEVLFSVNYNTNVDYDLKTGIADVGEKNYGRIGGSGGDSRLSLIYRANTITTNLNDGKFTQMLEGTLMLFPTEEQLDKEAAVKKEIQENLELPNKKVEDTLVADESIEGFYRDASGDYGADMAFENVFRNVGSDGDDD